MGLGYARGLHALLPVRTLMPHATISTFRRPRAWALGLVGAAVFASLPAGAQAPAAAAPASAASQPAGPTVRPEFGTPMQAAQALLNEGKAQEAMARIDEAGRVPNRTPYETYVLERTRAAAAQRLGNVALTMQALEVALSTGQAIKADELALLEAMISTSARERDHARVLRWSQRYLDLGGANDAVRLIRIQSQAASGDNAGALVAMKARVAAADQAGQPVSEAHLRLLLGLQQATQDAALAATLGRLAVAYPRPEYWADIVTMASREPGLGDRALLELYRLLRSTGNLTAADLREDMVQLSLKTGQPAEAQVVLDEGYASGVLGTGAQAAAHQKLRDQVRKQAAADKADRPAAETAAQRAKDGNALVDLGWAMVASLPAGAAPASAEPGLVLIEQGIAKGGLRRAAEARLHLGMAQIAAGRKDAARQTLQGLAGQPAPDGLATAVRLWTMFAAAPAMMPPRQ